MPDRYGGSGAEPRTQLEALILQARQNERKLRRFQALELKMIGVESLFELLQTMLYPDPSRFKWDSVSLLLLDHEYEIQRILEEDGVDFARHPNLLFVTERDDIEALYPPSIFPLLGPYVARRHHRLFPKRVRAPASVMLLPLVRHGRLIGSFNIGSLDAERFAEGVRTDFFEHLAATAAICLENAVNMERLKRQGLTDTLTGINNRRFFDQRLAEEVEAAKRSKAPLSCLLLDVDHFKRVNDQYGHLIGDRVLKDVALLVRGQLRGSDVLARYGGEEFVALLPATAEGAAIEVAERVREAIEGGVFRDAQGQPFCVTMSIGVTTFDPATTADAAQTRGESLVRQADICLYRCKQQGRNRVISSGSLNLGVAVSAG
ncbi:MAG: sensor domain-containing diguanylate cyclase [Gammaproteobacteria bacterium]|nr:sensor domain-containing diguanylate cyclase [Gammaproteobacteria bacterium]